MTDSSRPGLCLPLSVGSMKFPPAAVAALLVAAAVKTVAFRLALSVALSLVR